MLKKLASVLVLLVLCFSCLLPTAAMAAPENTIILEMGSYDKDDIDDLRYGRGKIMKKVEYALEQLQESGDLSDNYQPIIVITKKKSEGGL